ncbi:MAG: AAA family ATPase [Solirubrobacteraceae bacterium]
MEKSITNNSELQEIGDRIKEESFKINILSKEIKKVIIGQDQMIDSLIIGLIGGGHILLEGLPGLAKTLAVKTLSEAIQGKFSRIQFTPDLLPADVVGTLIFNMKENDFIIKKGPVFTNFLLADEINRAPAKVQSALLEAMQEKQVTIGDDTFKLEDPFLVLATQNPIEQEGTYPLPEAQTDRFMLKTIITYPSLEDERQVMRDSLLEEKKVVAKVFTQQDILNARKLINKVYVDEKVESYILSLVFATRNPAKYNLEKIQPLITYGSSPRGSINLVLASRVYAFIKGRAFVVPEDVRAVIKQVLRHRIGISYEAEAEEINSDNIIDMILNEVNVP